MNITFLEKLEKECQEEIRALLITLGYIRGKIEKYRGIESLAQNNIPSPSTSIEKTTKPEKTKLEKTSTGLVLKDGKIKVTPTTYNILNEMIGEFTTKDVYEHIYSITPKKIKAPSKGAIYNQICTLHRRGVIKKTQSGAKGMGVYKFCGNR